MTRKQREQAQENKRQFWRQHFEQWEQSGISQAAYCRQHELKLHCFIYWRKKFRRRTQSPIPLVQVQMPPNLTQTTGPVGAFSKIRLRVAANHCIEVERDFDPVALRQLLHVLASL